MTVVQLLGAVHVAVRVPVKPVLHVPVQAPLKAVGLLQPLKAPLAGLTGLLVHSARLQSNTGTAVRNCSSLGKSA